MAQYSKEQTDIAMWNQLSEDLKTMGFADGKVREIAEITGAVAQSRGYNPEQVMAGLQEGATQGVLSIDGTTVKFRKQDN